MKKSNLVEADERLQLDPTDVEAWLAKGMALMADEDFAGCQQAYTMGLIYDPFNPMLRFLRGRKYTSLDDYKMAVAELTLTTRLMPQKWEVWYYLGVALFLDEDFEGCKKAQRQAINIIHKNDCGCLPAPVCFFWQSCMKLGQKQEGQQILEDEIEEGMQCGTNADYLERMLLQKGLRDPETFLNDEKISKMDRPLIFKMTMTFGLAEYYYYHNQVEKSNELLKKVATSTHDHYAFAYKLAHSEIRHRGILL